MRGKLVPRANSSCNSALTGQGAFPIPRFPMPPSLQMLYFFKFKKSNRSTGFSLANSNGNIPANAPRGTHKLSSALQSSTSPNLQQQTTAAPKPHQWNMKPLLKQTPTHTHVLRTPLQLCSFFHYLRSSLSVWSLWHSGVEANHRSGILFPEKNPHNHPSKIPEPDC